MKKRINFLTKACIIALVFFGLNINVNAETTETDVAKINDTVYNSVKEAIAAAKEGDTVEVLNDSVESQTISVDKGIIINGNGHKIIANSLTGSNAAILINTSNAIVINNIIIETNTRGIAINRNVHNFTINNSTLNVGQRGITVNTDDNENSLLNVNDCIIQNKNVINYDEEVPNVDYRGISLWEYKNSTITIKNTTIQGFAYVINVTAPSSVYDSTNTNLIIDNSILKGRAGINYSNSVGYNINIKNSEILGINNQNGKSERFADIVLYSSSAANLNVENTKFLTYQNTTGLNNPYALQYMLDIRSINNNILISGDTSFVDKTEKLGSVFGYSKSDTTGEIIPELITNNNIEIKGGQYSYDVANYIPEGYKSVLIDGMYNVRKINPPIVDVEEIDLNTPTNKTSIGLTNASKTEEILLNALSTTDEVNTENRNVKVIIDMKDIELSNEQQEQFNNKIKDLTINNYFDISVNVIDIDTNETQKLTKLNEKITFGLIIPNELKNIDSDYTRDYYVIREHNGNYDLLDTILSEDGKSLTFETDRFSTYALAYIDKKVEKEPSDSGNKDDSTTEPEKNPGEKPNDKGDIVETPNKNQDNKNESIKNPSKNPDNKNEIVKKPINNQDNKNEIAKNPSKNPDNENETVETPNENPDNKNETIETPSKNQNNKNEIVEENPKTSDEITTYLIIGGISLLVVIVTVVYFMKKEI